MKYYTKEEAEKLYYYYLDELVGKPIGKGLPNTIHSLRIDIEDNGLAVVALAAVNTFTDLHWQIDKVAKEHGLPSPEEVLNSQG